jgi:hypothetical protein
MSLSPSSSLRSVRSIVLLTLAIACSLSSFVLAQSNVGNGSISGTVTDPSGAVVSGAKITITDKSTGQVITTASNSAGSYNSGSLVPGNYILRVEAHGFRTTEVSLTVLVNNTANGNVKLTVGQTSETVEVQASSVTVNTEQATVQGVLTSDQIDNLPVNGRNFLDLAQLEPGVQIQDGQNFDPTKAGYSSISFGGRFGRTARIEVDGVDVSDETVGTTTTDIPASAIQEFQISQSSLDLSTELTSSGAVNVTTKSGTNTFHGQGFGAFRDSTVGAASLPVPPGFTAPFQRSQYGGDFGGPILKDKLFFFMDGERTIQHTEVPVPVSSPFTDYAGTFQDPFHEANLVGKLDYSFKNAKIFARYSYFSNFLGATFGYGFSLYDNKDITRNTAVGVDFNTGSFTHSIRFSYLKFQNQIINGVAGTSLPFASLGAEIFMGATGLVAGPNLLAPQSTPQSDHQLKYDGSRILGAHVIRYGISYNHLQGGGFASFFKYGPQVSSAVTTADIAAAATGPFAGGASNPLNYPTDGPVTLANGLGYSFTKPALGFPAGGLGPDNRIMFYGGDTWKIKPNFALSYGIRYMRDTGRSDSQFPALPGLSALLPGLGNQVTQPNNNWAPQIGFAWDPKNSGKTSIRGGIGLFYENAIWNNVLFDGPYRESTGAFLQYFAPCSAPGHPNPLHTVSGTLNTPGSASAIAVCGAAGATSYPLMGNAIPAIIQLQQAYVAGSPFNLSAPNPSYVGSYLTACGATAATATNCSFAPGDNAYMFAPNYKTPRSVQMNIGVQHELRKGMVMSADFVRNVQTHYLLGVDQNHTGDINYFNLGAAQTAIATTNASFSGCNQPGLAGVDCAIKAGATMASYAGNGLTTTADFGGVSCQAAIGQACAFGGINPIAPPLNFLAPVGRSEYDGLQLKWTDNVSNPFRGVTYLNFQAAYSLSRFDNTGGGVGPGGTVTAAAADQDFIISALDNSNVNRYFGPSTLDRTNQISFGGYFNFPHGLQLGMMSHFYSPLSTTLTVPNTGAGAGEIFRTDFTGSGVTQDPVPGTKVGSFDRGIDAGNINNTINRYNATVAGNPTPAGDVLIKNSLMTAAELKLLNGVAPSLTLAPPGQVNLGWLHAFDSTLGWKYTFKERYTIMPSIGFYNLFNYANFDLPENMLSGLLSGGVGSINGTVKNQTLVNRVGVGTGVYTLGSPRELEWKLAFNF